MEKDKRLAFYTFIREPFYLVALIENKNVVNFVCGISA